jgi:hypothetical protein
VGLASGSRSPAWSHSGRPDLASLKFSSTAAGQHPLGWRCRESSAIMGERARSAESGRAAVAGAAVARAAVAGAAVARAAIAGEESG